MTVLKRTDHPLSGSWSRRAGLCMTFCGLLLGVCTAFAGGIDGGGNGLFVESPVSKHLVLWDLYVNNPLFSDPIPGDRIQYLNSPQNRESVGEFIDYRAFRSFAFLRSRLALWRPRAENLVRLISSGGFAPVSPKGAVKYQLNFVATPLNIEAVDEVAVPVSLKDARIRAFPGAYFDDSSGRVFINDILWDQVGQVSQAGLLLHERMRFLQLAFEIPNEEMQRLVSLILTRDPKSVSLNEYDDSRFSNSWIILHRSEEAKKSLFLNWDLLGAVWNAIFAGEMLDCAHAPDPIACAKPVLEKGKMNNPGFMNPLGWLQEDYYVAEAEKKKILSHSSPHPIPLVSTGTRNNPVTIVPTGPFAKMFGAYAIASCQDKSRIKPGDRLCKFDEFNIYPDQESPHSVNFSFAKTDGKDGKYLEFSPPAIQFGTYEEQGDVIASSKIIYEANTESEVTMRRISTTEYLLTLKEHKLDVDPVSQRDSEFQIRLIKK